MKNLILGILVGLLIGYLINTLYMTNNAGSYEEWSGFCKSVGKEVDSYWTYTDGFYLNCK